jgi:hypothetical protein
MYSLPDPLSTKVKRGFNVLYINNIPLFASAERGTEGVST